MTTSYNKIKRHSQDNMGVYHFVSRTKTRDKIATMYNILIIYSSKKDTLESVETKNIYKCNCQVVYPVNQVKSYIPSATVLFI